MSATYHIWQNGRNHGPFTKDEIRGMHNRGEMVGVLWRRAGDSDYQPHTELQAHLDEPPGPSRAASFGHIVNDGPAAAQSTKPEPSGNSTFGSIFNVFGMLILVAGLFIAVGGHSSAAYYITDGLVLVAVGTLSKIHAKLQLIAHRLQK